MVEWYGKILNMPSCELTPLMTLSIYVPIVALIIAIAGVVLYRRDPW